MAQFVLKDKQDDYWHALAVSDGHVLLCSADGQRLKVVKMINLADGSYACSNKGE